ncbi:hypothetical protein, partial [Vibrio rotiferianus]|uniref:hypothetical protein n=1 Tax=Vibrio rotiferianus TaxID=190895 RepID=UPI000576E861
AEPFGQRLWLLSTALSAYQVGQLHFKASALHKEPTNCCKNQLKRSTDPRYSGSYFRGKEKQLDGELLFGFSSGS